MSPTFFFSKALPRGESIVIRLLNESPLTAVTNLKVSSSPNQDNPILETEGEYYPIFGIDVWEHAYYLKYKNLRASYVSAFFDVVDWNQVAKNYENAINRK